MTKRKKTPPNAAGKTPARKLIATIARRHNLTELEAARLAIQYLTRASAYTSSPGWWVKLLDAQFQTHIGSYRRIRCGDERGLAHLTPWPGKFCHDCGCSRGEYHVFGCDSEECSNCGGQAFCCDC